MTSPDWMALGNWNATFARVLAQDVTSTVAAALIDSNGDGSHLEFEMAIIGEAGDWEIYTTYTDVGTERSAEFESYLVAWGRTVASSQLDVRFSSVTEQVSAGPDGWWVLVRHDPDQWIEPPEMLAISPGHEVGSYASTLTVTTDDGRVYTGDDALDVIRR